MDGEAGLEMNCYLNNTSYYVILNNGITNPIRFCHLTSNKKVLSNDKDNE
jgi:hypothetical protein